MCPENLNSVRECRLAQCQRPLWAVSGRSGNLHNEQCQNDEDERDNELGYDCIVVAERVVESLQEHCCKLLEP